MHCLSQRPHAHLADAVHNTTPSFPTHLPAARPHGPPSRIAHSRPSTFIPLTNQPSQTSSRSPTNIHPGIHCASRPDRWTPLYRSQCPRVPHAPPTSQGPCTALAPAEYSVSYLSGGLNLHIQKCVLSIAWVVCYGNCFFRCHLGEMCQPERAAFTATLVTTSSCNVHGVTRVGSGAYRVSCAGSLILNTGTPRLWKGLSWCNESLSCSGVRRACKKSGALTNGKILFSCTTAGECATGETSGMNSSKSLPCDLLIARIIVT